MMRARVFLQVVPEWCEGVNADGTLNLYGVSIAKMTQREPQRPLPGAVVVPVVLDIPSSLFGSVKAVQGSVTDTPEGVRLVPQVG